MSKKHKKEKEMQVLQKQEREHIIMQMLNYSKKRFKKFDEVIIQLYENKELVQFFTTDKRMWKINECFNNISTKNDRHSKARLKDVFIYLYKHSFLIADESVIQAVFNVFQYRASWGKDIFKWKPVAKQGSLQFRELASYLFCQYNVPEFLYQAFYETGNERFISWFVHLGTGGRVKEMKNIPIPFTQKMGHYFTQAPAKLTVTEALRWAQVMGLGGDKRAAERIAFSWIGNKPFADEIFWESFLSLLLRDSMFNYNKTTELIDYVRETKRTNNDYSLKGRTLRSLIRQSDEWHGKYAHIKGNWLWKSCGIEGFKLQRKTELIVMEEITEAEKLIEEGTAMKHCVASYAQYCAQGRSAIFSLRKYAGGILIDILATIEVNIFMKRIVQAKAKVNKPISEEAKKYMEAWARQQSLTITFYL